MSATQLPHGFTASSISADSRSTTDDGLESLKHNLIETFSTDPDLPALTSSITRITQLSSSDDHSIQQLAYYVLSDVSLTQKILRLSNSVAYRNASNKTNTSITKAIFLLGFNSVQTCALAMLLIDGLAGKQAEFVRDELMYALAASMFSRELVKAGNYVDAEEITIAALFKNLGRLLVAAYRPDLYQSMMTLITRQAYTQIQASTKVLGFNLDLLTEAILEKWYMPTSIIQSIKNRSTGDLTPARNKQEWLQQAAEFSVKAAPLVLDPGEAGADALKIRLLERFGKAFHLDKLKLEQLIQNAVADTRLLLINTNLLDPGHDNRISADTTHPEFAISNEESLLDELTVTSEVGAEIQILQRYPSGKPHNASALLLAGLQDIAEILGSENFKLENVIMLILEIYYNSLGFGFITLSLKDSKINGYRARSSLGKNNVEYQRAISFSSADLSNLFLLALQKNADLLIADARNPKLGALIPKWHKELFPEVQSFMVLPLVTRNKPIGFIYANRETMAPEGITAEETRLIKALKGQLLAAFNTK
ncbi:MAG: HDOD domain-containing protein [Nitrosomonas sp.]|nr:MAG: HDOD domain-containing protein [Nitrosomonas sp.]